MTLMLTRALQHQFLQALEQIEDGQLTLITPEGTTHHFGQPSQNGAPEAELRIHDWAMLPALISRGDVGLGESYVAGQWCASSVEAVVQLASLNFTRLEKYGEPTLLNRLRFLLVDRVLRANSQRGSARNIKSHYDVGNEFYQLWLDPTMNYSSALYENGETDMVRAQTSKMDRILSRLSPGESVLEVGCGWGGFAERAAETGRNVTGITISPSQKGYADARLDGRADIRLQDYRATSGTFDNIVSIEMIEAVGERYWPVYFQMIRDRLAEGGRAVIQAITVPDRAFDNYRRRSDFIRQYVFPGGMLPCSASIAASAEAVGLRVTDNFDFGKSYARTCREWSANLQAQARRVDALGYDAAFRRSWHYYLESCAAVFETGDANVVQVQLAHAR